MMPSFITAASSLLVRVLPRPYAGLSKEHSGLPRSRSLQIPTRTCRLLLPPVDLPCRLLGKCSPDAHYARGNEKAQEAKRPWAMMPLILFSDQRVFVGANSR